MKKYLLKNVFVAGGEPSVTYNPRPELDLEGKIRDYLEERLRILSVSGPTKSGKTVLVRRIVPKGNGLWVPGGQISNELEFWTFVNESFGGEDTFQKEESSQHSESITHEGDAAVRPLGVGAGFKRGVQEGNSNGTKTAKTWKLSPKNKALELLVSNDVPLIIDDFHYIPQEEQRKIVRALKDPIFDGLAVIALSVPHRTFDTIRAEREMTGRVAQLNIPLWNQKELEEIAISGFAALNIKPQSEFIERLSEESFGSPHLMQDFCKQICRINDIKETLDDVYSMSSPPEWASFFRERAVETSKPAFDRLAMGPRQRTDKKQRDLKHGGEADIYIAVLTAIAETGPKVELTYEEIRSSLRTVLAEMPQAHEISRVLEKMTEIAKREKGQGEPVLDWYEGKLHISDPFFAYYLKWAVRERVE